MSSFRIIEGDCIEAMRAMDEASIEAIVTDPPYGLGFMGREWDALPPGEEFAAQALRVLKPGGHLLAFGGTRTYHRLACAIEDAGFEIRDCLAWLYGSGFPKSLDVSKAIDKAAGVEGTYGEPKSEAHAGWIERGAMRGGEGHEGYQRPWMADEQAVDKNARRYEPASDDARAFVGFGTALKPAHEPIVLARKPLTGTVAANVQAFGTGALNVDGCRVDTGGEHLATPQSDPSKRAGEVGRDLGISDAGIDDFQSAQAASIERTNTLGRWPANVILDPEAAALLDEQSGERGGSGKASGPTVNRLGDHGIYGHADGERGEAPFYGDTGGASRFFYTAKASRAERNAGLEGFEEREVDTGHVQRTRNVHPTVKPIALMRWLCRLVTPPGGTVLDPFTGSGTTGCAAVLEDFDFIGIERESEYVAIAEARVAHWAAQPKQLGLL